MSETIASILRLGRSQQNAQWIWSSTLTTMNISSPAIPGPPTLMSWFPSLPLLPHPPIVCLRLTRGFPIQPSLALLPCLFPMQDHQTPVLVSYWFARRWCESPASQWELRFTLPVPACFLFQGHQNYCSCLLLVRSEVVWEPSEPMGTEVHSSSSLLLPT
jgi:hypothetical protein